jgi:hypothetical protein
VSENISFENYAGGTAQILGGDFFNEGRDINVRGACDGAGRVKAEEAAGSFDGGLAGRHARGNFREILFVLLGRKFGGRLAQRHDLPSFPWAKKRRHSSISDCGKGQGFADVFGTELLAAES